MATLPPRRLEARGVALDLLILSGFGLVSYGSWRIFTPAGFIVAGLLLLALGLKGIRR